MILQSALRFLMDALTFIVLSVICIHCLTVDASPYQFNTVTVLTVAL
jgi:hypothetical protein